MSTVSSHEPSKDGEIEQISELSGRISLDDTNRRRSCVDLRQHSRERLASLDERERLKNEIEMEEDDSMSTLTDSQSRSITYDEEVLSLQTKLAATKERKQQIFDVFKNLKNAQRVDLCFLIDCTRSMDKYITEVKDKIQLMVAEMRQRFKDLKLYISFVGYRDHCDGANRIVSLGFTDSISSFTRFVQNIRTRGGGDVCEDVFGGMEAVCKLNWLHPTRILFHVCDAPCHGRRFHHGEVDDYPDGDPRNLNIETLLRKIQEYRIAYWFARLNPSTDKMIEEFAKVMAGDNQVHTVNLQNVNDLMPAVSQSISESIIATESVTLMTERFRDHDEPTNNRLSTTRTPKPYTVSPNMPNWNNIQHEEVIVFSNKLPVLNAESCAELKEPLEVKSQKTIVKIGPNSFSVGAQRIAYYGLEFTFNEKKRVVFKEFKFMGTGLNKLDKYKEQMEIQSVAACMAQRFNTYTLHANLSGLEPKKILFTKVSTVSFKHRPKPFYCSKEPLIEGSYVKYTSNCGFVNKNEYTPTLNAFSHWTHHFSDGYLMVVDLQGVRSEKDGEVTFTLTDPAIHCKDLMRFGSCNLGKKGMARFFRNHICNDICHFLQLPEHKRQVMGTAFDI